MKTPYWSNPTSGLRGLHLELITSITVEGSLPEDVKTAIRLPDNAPAPISSWATRVQYKPAALNSVRSRALSAGRMRVPNRAKSQEGGKHACRDDRAVDEWVMVGGQVEDCRKIPNFRIE